MSASVDVLQEFFKDAPGDISLSQLNLNKLPKHVAIIMDGNGRWATSRGLVRSKGHVAGIDGVREVIKSCVKLHIPYLTIFAFSTENWSRSTEEVNTLMKLFAKTLHKEMPLLQEEKISLKLLGDINSLPTKTQNSFIKARDLTKDNKNMTLGVAVNYGSRQEIVRATQYIANQVSAGEISSDQIDEDLITRHLYTKGMPDPDLLIRTSGEKRVSNFLLWQIAYTEFYVTDTLWPDFNRFHFLQALIEYQRRDRRFGGVF